MNPNTNRFEELGMMKELFKSPKESELQQKLDDLLRPNGEPVPKHWSVFTVGDNYVINNYTFKCVYVGETSILFEPVGIVTIGEETK